MPNRNKTEDCRRPAGASRSAAAGVTQYDLPPTLQGIVDQNWRKLKKQLEADALLSALECFNRYFWRRPVATAEQVAEKRAQALLAAIRELGEGSEFFQRFCVDDEEEMRLRCHVFAELYEKALAGLTGEQRRIIRLAKRAGLSFARIAQNMGFQGITEVKKIYRGVWFAILAIIQNLLGDELQQPAMAVHRRSAILAWRELLEHKTAAPIMVKLLASLPYFLALYYLGCVHIAGVT